MLDPLTAYQMVSILEGVVQRGTGTALKVVGKPLAGKTGTTNDAKDVWFVGFSPDLAVGVYLGYDKPQSLGDRATGGELLGADRARLHADGAEGQAADAVPRAARHQAHPRRPRLGHARRLGRGRGAILEAFKPGTGAARQLRHHRLRRRRRRSGQRPRPAAA